MFFACAKGSNFRELLFDDFKFMAWWRRRSAEIEVSQVECCPDTFTDVFKTRTTPIGKKKRFKLHFVAFEVEFSKAEDEGLTIVRAISQRRLSFCERLAPWVFGPGLRTTPALDRLSVLSAPGPDQRQAQQA